MKKIQYLSSLILVLFSSALAFPHAVFIETNPHGNKGEEHNITIFYIEPGEENKETLKEWWSDTSDLKLWLALPDGTREQLVTIKHTDHITAKFVPTTNGEYFVSLHHTVASLAGKTQYQFNASSKITIGSGQHTANLFAPNDSKELILVTKEKSSSNQISLTMTNKGVAVASYPITIFAPNGWQKVIKTNEYGIASFSGEWSGKYVFEAIVKEEVVNMNYSYKERIITTTLNKK